jgi:di/tricarboxylate transporter
MTLDQGLAFAIVIAMMGLFAWGRWRYDLVAVLALLVAVAVGIVPPDQAFKGFSDDIVIIVASALVVSAISPPCRRRSVNSTARRWPSATSASAVA